MISIKQILLNEIYKLKRKHLYYIFIGIALICFVVTFGYTKNPISVSAQVLYLNVLDLMVSILLPIATTIIIGSLISDERNSREISIFLLNGKITIEKLIYAKFIIVVFFVVATLFYSFIIVDISLYVMFKTPISILLTLKYILLEIVPMLGICAFIMTMSFYVRNWLLLLVYFCIFIGLRLLNIIIPVSTFLTPFSIVSLLLAGIDNQIIVIDTIISLIWLVIFSTLIYQISKHKDLLS